MLKNITPIPTELVPNYAEWALKPTWTLFEATCLSFSADPNKLRYEKVNEIKNPDTYLLTTALKYKSGAYGSPAHKIVHIEGFSPRFEIVLRQDWDYGFIQDYYRPEHKEPAKDLVEWFANSGIDFPAELKKCVEKSKVSPIKLVEVKKKNLKAPSESARAKTIRSLNKVVIAMAMEKYHFKPNDSKNSATGNIGRTIEKYGMRVDNDTILARLRDAYEENQDEIEEYTKPNSD